MIKFQNEDKTLTVPSGLGNFPSNAGGGSDVTRQDVVNIVNSAITEYDTEVQADLEGIREDVSGNTEDIAAHGAALADMRSDIDALSGTARDIRWDVDSISARTIANTSDIAALSAATEGIEGTVRSVVSNVETISGQTSANTAHIQTLSGAVETNELAISNLENYTQNELASAIGGIGQNLGVLSGQVETLSSSTVNGLETAQNTANSANTLASSAYTRADAAYALAESLTGASGGPEVVILNKLTEQERLALYNTINSYYDQNTQSFTTAWTEDLYAFYIDLRTQADQEDYQVNDQYEGFFPMQVTRVHPSDYGGAVFFCGVEGDRNGNARLINIRFVITYEGQVDKGTWWVEPFQEPMQFDLFINSDGTMEQGQDWSVMGDPAKAVRIVMRYHNETQYGGIDSVGRIKWSNMYPTTYNGETKMYWIWAADICVGTTMYSGVWGMIQDQWYYDSDVPPQLLQWTSGATYESQTYPPIS